VFVGPIVFLAQQAAQKEPYKPHKQQQAAQHINKPRSSKQSIQTKQTTTKRNTYTNHAAQNNPYKPHKQQK
jgi:hypothetical protein